MRVPSLIMAGLTTSLDPYGTNPLADHLRSASPSVYSRAVQRNGRPPKMFMSGVLNLPLFTASGIDPHWLLELPFTARHYAADLPTEADVTDLIRRCTDPGARYDHEGFDQAVARVRAWANSPTPASSRAEAPQTQEPRPTASQHRRQADGDTRHPRVSQRPGYHLAYDWATIVEASKRGEILPKVAPTKAAAPPAAASPPTASPPVQPRAPRPAPARPAVTAPPQPRATRQGQRPPVDDSAYLAIWPTTDDQGQTHTDSAYLAIWPTTEGN